MKRNLPQRHRDDTARVNRTTARTKRVLPTVGESIEVSFLDDDGMEKWWLAELVTLEPKRAHRTSLAFASLKYFACHGHDQVVCKVQFHKTGKLSSLDAIGRDKENSNWRFVLSRELAERSGDLHIESSPAEQDSADDSHDDDPDYEQEVRTRSRKRVAVTGRALKRRGQEGKGTPSLPTSCSKPECRAPSRNASGVPRGELVGDLTSEGRNTVHTEIMQRLIRLESEVQLVNVRQPAEFSAACLSELIYEAKIGILREITKPPAVLRNLDSSAP